MKNSISNNKTQTVQAGYRVPDAQALLSLMESDEKYRLLTELIDDAIVIVQNGLIRECNNGLSKICGYSRDEVVDTCFASFFHSDHFAAVESLCEPSQQCPNGVRILPATLVCKNGNPFRVEMTSALCAIRQNPATMLIIREIPERILGREDLPNHCRQDSMAAMSGGTDHDYNSLLTAIIGNITLAQTYLNPDDKPFRLLHKALAAAKTARNLTQKLITFSRGAPPNKKSTDSAYLFASRKRLLPVDIPMTRG